MIKKIQLINGIFLVLVTSFFVSGLKITSNSENITINALVQLDSSPLATNDRFNTLSYPFHLLDGYDRNVTFSGEPQKIISIAPSVTEVIYAVGAGDKLVAVDLSSNYPNETASLPKIANFPTLDIEAILLYNPDLVLGAGITSLDDIETLENQGVTVFTLAPFDVAGVLEDIEKVGLITNNVDNAQTLKSSLQDRIDAVTQISSTFNYKPKIYLEYFSEPLFTFGPGTYGHDLIVLAGAKNILQVSFF
ncbi:MAG: ABC transporter substrate-binding protein [Candidatus Hodarchaeales archaeon]|jgi:iron complex transport system substrate-binding protein